MFDLRNRSATSKVHTYKMGDVVKLTRPGSHPVARGLVAYPTNPKLCVVTHLKEYEHCARVIRGNNNNINNNNNTNGPYLLSKDSLVQYTVDWHACTIFQEVLT